MLDERRSTHIERVYGKGDNSDAWVDIEMLDRLVDKGDKGQETVHQFHCNPKESQRKGHKIRIENPDNKDQFVEVTIWDEYRTDDTVQKFANCKENKSRNKATKKVTKRDIDGQYLDDNKQPPANPKDYLNAIKSTNIEDKDHRVCVEVVKTWDNRGRGDPLYDLDEFSPSVLGQGATNKDGTTCASDVLPKKECDTIGGGGSGSGASSSPSLQAVGPSLRANGGGGGSSSSGSGSDSMGSDDQPVSMDPLQWVVNIGWGGLAVDFGEKAEDSTYVG
jgi:hypothetical protein